MSGSSSASSSPSAIGGHICGVVASWCVPTISATSTSSTNGSPPYRNTIGLASCSASTLRLNTRRAQQTPWPMPCPSVTLRTGQYWPYQPHVSTSSTGCGKLRQRILLWSRCVMDCRLGLTARCGLCLTTWWCSGAASTSHPPRLCSWRWSRPFMQMATKGSRGRCIVSGAISTSQICVEWSRILCGHARRARSINQSIYTPLACSCHCRYRPLSGQILPWISLKLFPKSGEIGDPLRGGPL